MFEVTHAEVRSLMWLELQQAGLEAGLGTEVYASEPALPVEVHRQRDLLWAVLESAITEYRKYGRATKRSGKKLFQQAEAYLLNDDESWPCSIVNLCSLFRIDVRKLRKYLQHERTCPAAPQKVVSLRPRLQNIGQTLVSDQEGLQERKLLRQRQRRQERLAA